MQKKSTDTKVMALLHGHDLNFKSFKYKTGLLNSPFCHVCPGKIDNNIHQLMECSKYQCEYRRNLKELIDASANLPQAMLIHANLEHVNSFRNMAQLVIVKQSYFTSLSSTLNTILSSCPALQITNSRRSFKKGRSRS